MSLCFSILTVIIWAGVEIRKEKADMDILHMIPSRDMKQCLIKHDYCFSDREILAFLYDRSKSVPELFGYLREFISDCEDIDLVRLVTSYMKNVETDNERFRHNIASEDRIYQCAIYYEDGSEKGQIYTYDYDIAYQYENPIRRVLLFKRFL